MSGSPQPGSGPPQEAEAEAGVSLDPPTQKLTIQEAADILLEQHVENESELSLSQLSWDLSDLYDAGYGDALDLFGVIPVEKAVKLGQCETLEEIIWYVEKHQDEPNFMRYSLASINLKESLSLLTLIYEVYIADFERRKNKLKLVYKILDNIWKFGWVDDKYRHVNVNKLKDKGIFVFWQQQANANVNVIPNSGSTSSTSSSGKTNLHRFLLLVGFKEEQKLAKEITKGYEKQFTFEYDIASDRLEVVRFHRALSILDDLLFIWHPHPGAGVTVGVAQNENDQELEDGEDVQFQQQFHNIISSDEEDYDELVGGGAPSPVQLQSSSISSNNVNKNNMQSPISPWWALKGDWNWNQTQKSGSNNKNLKQNIQNQQNKQKLSRNALADVHEARMQRIQRHGANNLTIKSANATINRSPTATPNNNNANTNNKTQQSSTSGTPRKSPRGQRGNSNVGFFGETWDYLSSLDQNQGSSGSRKQSRNNSKNSNNNQQNQSSSSSSWSSSSSSNQRQHQTQNNINSENREFRKSKHFTLKDIEELRYKEAIKNAPRYAEEYWNRQGNTGSYSNLISRSLDPTYLGMKALDGTNVFRGQNGLPPLKWNDAMAKIAEKHAQQMASGQAPFSHDGFNQRIAQFPFYSHSSAENLAWNQGVGDSAQTAVAGWIDSPGHRKNLLSLTNLCGIGVGKSNDGKIYYTQLFAKTNQGLC